MFQYDGLVVGQRIRNLRIEAGYGLGEFSDELGKSESHIKQVELGSRKISLDLSIQNKIKRCLNLLRYMNISQELVDFVYSFIFKY